MTRHTCMACGLNIRCAYGSWLHHHPWAAAAFAAPARIVGQSDRHPTAALTLAVPGTIIALAAIATYPLVFVPLVVLVGVALVASVRYEEIRYEENTRDPTCWRADCPDMRGRRKVPDSEYGRMRKSRKGDHRTSQRLRQIFAHGQQLAG